MGGGLNLFNRHTGKFTRYRQHNNRISSDYVFKILEDANQNIWIGTSYGMNVLMKGSSTFGKLINNANDNNSLINDNINSFM